MSYGLVIRCWATIRDTVGWLMLQRRAISAPDFRPVMKLLAISSRLAAVELLSHRLAPHPPPVPLSDPQGAGELPGMH